MHSTTNSPDRHRSLGDQNWQNQAICGVPTTAPTDLTATVTVTVSPTTPSASRLPRQPVRSPAPGPVRSAPVSQ